MQKERFSMKLRGLLPALLPVLTGCGKTGGTPSAPPATGTTSRPPYEENRLVTLDVFARDLMADFIAEGNM